MKKLILICGLLAPGFGYCGEREAIRNAGLTVAAFSCSAFNSYIKEEKEAERLFNIGYKSGTDFYNYTAKNKISSDALNKEIPFLYLMIAGPSIDFNLGQLYSSVSDTAVKKIFQDSSLNFVYDEDLRKIKAQNLVRDNNCRLLK
ncbi:MAG TPA: hypothetical protein DCD99_11415 [Acinetobacter schindleri]|nr:hypothetical protein [Acinetobacter schindleri]